MHIDHVTNGREPVCVPLSRQTPFPPPRPGRNPVRGPVPVVPLSLHRRLISQTPPASNLDERFQQKLPLRGLPFMNICHVTSGDEHMSVPEGHRKLAGGEAKRNHRNL